MVNENTGDMVREFVNKLTTDLELKRLRQKQCQSMAEVKEGEARMLRAEAKLLIPEIAGLQETLEAIQVFSPYVQVEDSQEVVEVEVVRQPEPKPAAEVIVPKMLNGGVSVELRPEVVINLKDAPKALTSHNHSNGRPQAFRLWRLKGHQGRPALEGNHDTKDTVLVVRPNRQKLQLKLATAAKEYGCHECGSVIEWGKVYVKYTDMQMMARRANMPKDEQAKLPDPNIIVCQLCCVFDIELVVWKDMVEDGYSNRGALDELHA